MEKNAEQNLKSPTDPKMLKQMQHQVIQEFEVRGMKGRHKGTPRAHMNPEAIGDGTLEQIITGIKSEPYLSTDALRYFQRSIEVMEGIFA